MYCKDQSLQAIDLVSHRETALSGDGLRQVPDGLVQSFLKREKP
jgi:hypothetical protein